MPDRASYIETSFTPDRLIAGDMQLVPRTITLVSGQNLARGAVLGKISASGKYTLSASAAGDGSNTPDLILADDCDASAGDATAIAYVTGIFNEGALILGAGHTVSSIREGLRGKSIHLIPTAGA